MNGIQGGMKDENESVSILLRNILVKELVHGTSLTCYDEGESTCAIEMPRLVCRLTLSDMGCTEKCVRRSSHLDARSY